MSLLMRRRMLLSQQKKSNNLLDESLLLTQQSGYCEKVENGYQFLEYPTQYSLYNNSNEPLINHLKSVLKPDTDYTFAYYVVTRNTSSSAGSFAIRNQSSALFSIPYGLGLRIGTFRFTQEQIDSIYNVWIYGTRQIQIANGVNPTVIKDFQLLEGVYTKDTLPLYEPYEE